MNWRQIEKAGVQTLTWDDPGYPVNLRAIAQPPPVIYLKGYAHPGR